MDVTFKNAKLQKLCETEKELDKAFGKRSKKIQRRLKVLQKAENLAQVPYQPPERCHQLKGNKDEKYAVVIEDQWRIIFEIGHAEVPRMADGGVDKEKVTSIKIIDVCEDYH